MRHPLRERSFHRGLASGFECFHSLGGRQKILSHVTALAERRFELLEYQKDFPVVAPGLMPGFYVNQPDLAAVLSCVEIGTRPIMRVIETQTRRTRSECDAPHSARCDEGRSFLRRSVDIRRNELSVPMQLFWCVRVIVHFEGHRLALFE